MVKITIDGKEGRRIVNYLELPQPIELIEQRNGQCVTVETCRALAFDSVDPAGDGEASELVRWLWQDAGDRSNVGARWNGWQAAAWIATNDLAVVARLSGTIEFRGQHGGRPTLHARTVEICLRWEIATRHCRCGADRDGLCFCLDKAFGKLNAALLDQASELIELEQQSQGPVNRDNARGMLFAGRTVQSAFTVPKRKGAPRGGGVHQSRDEAIASMILKQVANGVFPNKGQAITAFLDRVPGNSDGAKRKRLYRAFARIEAGH